jgi:UDP-N-acetylglucosamine:LPS N-acetylglucosamine transferase
MPLFFSSRRRILWFSRGNGRGHAITDLVLLDRTRRLRNDFEVCFVSYATGAETFREFKHPVIDLDLPARNPFWETLVLTGSVIRRTRPELVVCHEEFAPLAAARIFGLPTVFLTHWFWEPDNLIMQTLGCAGEVIFIEQAGTFDEPQCVRGRVHYVGAVLREFSYTKADRSRAREELGLPPEATVICVLPGSWTEERAPIADLILPAYTALEAMEKRLVWIAGQDCDALRHAVQDRDDVIVREVDWIIDRLMVASDVAITKANYTTMKELAALGVPSISLSPGINPIDDLYARRIETNIALDAREATVDQVIDAIQSHLDGAAGIPSDSRLGSGGPVDGAVKGAERLAYHIGQLRGGRQSFGARSSGVRPDAV